MTTSADRLTRIGTGSIGGKARGLGFLNLLVNDPVFRGFPNTAVTVPRASVITTGEFKQFIEDNDLGHAISSHTDEVVLHAFTRGRLRPRLVEALSDYLAEHKRPLAVRSSSLNEDAYDHPFAGLYKTVLLPNNSADEDTRRKQLEQAIKLVYASTYLAAPKAYMRKHGLPIEQEAMGVILQELAGQPHRFRFYPRLAGVAQSINYFPSGGLKAADGVCRLVVGLGHRALDVDNALCFSPRNPKVRALYPPRVLQQYMQKELWVVDLTRGEIDIGQEERTTLRSLPLDKAGEDGMLEDLVGWWTPGEDAWRDAPDQGGEPLLTFGRLLDGELFPFNEVLSELLARAEKGFRGPVEIEFAADFERTSEGVRATVYALQVRRIGRPHQGDPVDWVEVPDHRVLVSTRSALGNGVDEDFQFVIYVPPGKRTADDLSALASEISELNRLVEGHSGRSLLIGPGRWGSKSRHLGIPVTYNQVSSAACIVEVASADFPVGPSQGTHFFQNITAGRVYYMAVNLAGDDRLNTAWFDAQPDVRGQRAGAAKLIALQRRTLVRVDGATQRGMVYLD